MKIKPKYIACIVIAAILSVMYLTDLIISGTYSITVVKINPQSAPADGKTPVEIEVRLTNSGKNITGHELYAIAKGGGSFGSQRVVTDESGVAKFTYYPFLSSAYMKAGDVPIEIMDESNSLFVSVPARKSFTVRLIEPASGGDDEYTTGDIFGES